MRYMGGKHDFANELAIIIGSGDVLIEPFMGGGSMTTALAPSFRMVYAYDNHIDLVLMWQALLEGWIPPNKISREEYYLLKKQNNSALRGFVGFSCAFGSAWFGSYAFDDKGGRNFAGEAKRILMTQIKQMKNVVVDLEDYRNLIIPPGVTIYADPPYGGTTGYRNPLDTNDFNSREFWKIADLWAENGATVFVSEFNAPGGWTLVWEKERYERAQRTLTVRNKVVERLYCKG